MKYKLIKDQWNILIVKDHTLTGDTMFQHRGVVVCFIKRINKMGWEKVGRGYSYAGGQDIFESDDLDEVKQMANLEVL